MPRPSVSDVTAPPRALGRQDPGAWRAASAFDQEQAEPCSPLSLLLRARRQQEGAPSPCLLGRTRAAESACASWQQKPVAVAAAAAKQWAAERACTSWPQKPVAVAAAAAEQWVDDERPRLALAPIVGPGGTSVDQWVDCDSDHGARDDDKENTPPELQVIHLCSHLYAASPSAGAAVAEAQPVLATTPAMPPRPAVLPPPGPPPGLPLRPGAGAGLPTTPSSFAPVLRLDELLSSHGNVPLNETPRNEVPGLASAGFPSAGSVWHAVGTCRPCAFIFKAVSCAYGMNCAFCHLCGPGERSRRKRNQKVAKKVVQALAATAPWALSPMTCQPLGAPRAVARLGGA